MRAPIAALLALALLAGCAAPQPAFRKSTPDYASSHVPAPARAAANGTADFRRADDAAYAYEAGTAPDPAVTGTIRNLETAADAARARHDRAASRRAVGNLRKYLAAHGIH